MVHATNEGVTMARAEKVIDNGARNKRNREDMEYKYNTITCTSAVAVEYSCTTRDSYLALL